ncbi:hypothetical protein ES703_110034 [subsurface metagenome]
MLYKGREKEYKRQHYQIHKEEYKERTTNLRRRYRREALDLFYNQCFICGVGSKRRLEFHKKDGSPHHRTSLIYVLKNPEAWVLLCGHCHKGVHWCMSFLRYNWEEIKHFSGLGKPEFKENSNESNASD